MENGKRILLITEDRHQAREISSRLEKEGFKVDSAYSGDEGLERYFYSRHDVILLDYSLHGMTGLDVLKALNKLNTLPICIFLTGEGNEELTAEAIRLGVSDFISKEADNPESIVFAIRQLLRMQQVAAIQGQAEAANRTILAALPDWVLKLDRNGVVQVSVCPPGREPLWPDNRIGKPLWELLSAQAAETILKALTTSLNYLTMQQVSVPIHTGECERHLECRFSPCDAHSAIVVLRDTSEFALEAPVSFCADEGVMLAEEKMIKSLTGLLAMCSSCKRIRDDGGFWKQLEVYLQEHSTATFSHTMCPGCQEEWYGNIRR